jgi:hypothetical protein
VLWLQGNTSSRHGRICPLDQGYCAWSIVACHTIVEARCQLEGLFGGGVWGVQNWGRISDVRHSKDGSFVNHPSLLLMHFMIVHPLFVQVNPRIENFVDV